MWNRPCCLFQRIYTLTIFTGGKSLILPEAAVEVTEVVEPRFYGNGRYRHVSFCKKLHGIADPFFQHICNGGTAHHSLKQAAILTWTQAALFCQISQCNCVIQMRLNTYEVL